MPANIRDLAEDAWIGTGGGAKFLEATFSDSEAVKPGFAAKLLGSSGIASSDDLKSSSGILTANYNSIQAAVSAVAYSSRRIVNINGYKEITQTIVCPFVDMEINGGGFSIYSSVESFAELRWTSPNDGAILNIQGARTITVKGVRFSKTGTATVVGILAGRADGYASRYRFEDCVFDGLAFGIDGGRGTAFPIFDSVFIRCHFINCVVGEWVGGSQHTHIDCQWSANGRNFVFGQGTDGASRAGITIIGGTSVGSTYDFSFDGVTAGSLSTYMRGITLDGYHTEESTGGVIEWNGAGPFYFETFAALGTKFSTRSKAVGSMLDFTKGVGSAFLGGCKRYQVGSGSDVSDMTLAPGANVVVRVVASNSFFAGGVSQSWEYNNAPFQWGPSGTALLDGNASGDAFLGGSATDPAAIVRRGTARANIIELRPAGGGFRPGIYATGSDTDIGLNLLGKGAGPVALYGYGGNVVAALFNPALNGVNYPSISGAATGGDVSLSAQGSDANIYVTLKGKGTAGGKLVDGGGGIRAFWTTSGIGFNGKGASIPTLAAALATDGSATSAQMATAINSIRTALINLGLTV